MIPRRFVARVRHLDARIGSYHWAWAEANREIIASNWTRVRAQSPRVFNGRVLLVSEAALEGDTIRARYFETDYADFLGWRDLGFPDESVANGFAMGALRAADGAFVLGVMGPHTANAGRVYFAAGTPDPTDLRPDGTVDLASSVVRELEEETGLTPDGMRFADEWVVVREGPKIAFLRPIRHAEPGEALAARIVAHLERDPEPELAGVRLVRGPADIDEAAMPDFLKTFLRWSFDGEAQR